MSVDLQITNQGFGNDLPHQRPRERAGVLGGFFRTRPGAPAGVPITNGLRGLEVKTGAGKRSRVRNIEPQAGLIPAQRHAVLSVLLDATVPLARCGDSAFKPLWVDEAMNRARDMAGLVAELEHQNPCIHQNPEDSKAEYQAACDFAEALRSLAMADDRDMQPCFEVLHVSVFSLVQLFGRASATISVERLTLPAYKRRALVLASCELVLNLLRQGLMDGSAGNITVTLRRTSRAVAQLSVESDGNGVSKNILPPPGGIASDLAAILEADVVYSTRTGGATAAEISFPVAALI